MKWLCEWQKEVLVSYGYAGHEQWSHWELEVDEEGAGVPFMGGRVVDP